MVMTAGNFSAPDHLYILNPSACASCARMIEMILLRSKKPRVSSLPKKYEHPRTSLCLITFSQNPFLLSTGSAHIRSQNSPDFGISRNRSIFLMSSS